MDTLRLLVPHHLIPHFGRSCRKSCGIAEAARKQGMMRVNIHVKINTAYQSLRQFAMPGMLPPFLLHWAITSLSLWAASYVFDGIRFASTGSLIIAALLLGFANAIVRPLLIVLTLPLTFVTLGFFLLVINALMILLVSAVVRGFTVSGFWTAFFAAIFISVLSFFISVFLGAGRPPMGPSGGTWI